MQKASGINNVALSGFPTGVRTISCAALGWLYALAVKHSGFWDDEPCQGELVIVQDTDRIGDLPPGCQMLWCSRCGTEFRYRPGKKWVTVIYTGCVDKQ